MRTLLTLVLLAGAARAEFDSSAVLQMARAEAGKAKTPASAVARDEAAVCRATADSLYRELGYWLRHEEHAKRLCGATTDSEAVLSCFHWGRNFFKGQRFNDPVEKAENLCQGASRIAVRRRCYDAAIREISLRGRRGDLTNTAIRLCSGSQDEKATLACFRGAYKERALKSSQGTIDAAVGDCVGR